MRYEAPSSAKEAAKLLAGAKGKAVVLAGGTDLLVKMKSGALEPDLIVDIKRIDATQVDQEDRQRWFQSGRRCFRRASRQKQRAQERPGPAWLKPRT